MPTTFQATATLPHEGAQLRPGGAAGWMIAAGLALAATGSGAAGVLGWTTSESQRLFYHAYLVAFTCYLSITLGALFFVLLQHLTRAGWSVSLRRLAEGISGNIWLMLALSVPLLLGMGHVYEWWPADWWNERFAWLQQWVGVGEPQLWMNHGGHGHEGHLGAKGIYLSPGAFLTRWAIYFVIWGGLTWYLRSRSIRQDASGDPRLSTAMERLSAPGMIALSFTFVFVAVDLLMSTNPHWYSTIFGVYFFAGCTLSFLCTLALVAVAVRSDAVTTEHLHDLGKLMLGFTVFWGYIAFSQYMLTWYANLPEETQFYMVRQIGPWVWVSAALVVGHLFVPFFGLLARFAKRRRGLLTFWAAWLLAAHVLDLFWLVMPNLYLHEMPRAAGVAPGTPMPEVLRELLASNQDVYRLAEGHPNLVQAVWMPLEWPSVALVVALVLGMGGVYLANTVWMLRRAALVPLGDPRLPESLAFENG